MYFITRFNCNLDRSSILALISNLITYSDCKRLTVFVVGKYWFWRENYRLLAIVTWSLEFVRRIDEPNSIIAPRDFKPVCAFALTVNKRSGCKNKINIYKRSESVTDFFVPHVWAACYLKLNGTIIQRPDVTLEINTTRSEFPSNGNDDSASDFT